MNGREAAFEAAVMAALAGDAGVAAAFGDPLRVLRAASERPVYPYLELARHERTDAGASGAEASDHRVDLALVFRDGGRMSAMQALGAVRAAIDAAALEMEGWRCVVFGVVFSDLLSTRLGGWRGLVRVRAVVEPM